MRKLDAKNLLEKYHSGECTIEEKLLVESYFVSEKFDVPALSKEEIEEDERSIREYVFARIQKPTRFLWIKPIAAAAAMITVALTIYLTDIKTPEKINENAFEQVQPGSNKAILTLASGQKINLTNAGNGNLAIQNGIQISKTAEGEIVYTVNGNGNASSPNHNTQINTLSTPRGGTFQIILPDGTKVKLNAASSLQFPTTFTGVPTRRVVLAGEAYFEVSKDKKHPFIVHALNQEIKVLGTHFNVNAYTDEKQIKTTLLEGSVSVSVASADVKKKNSGDSPSPRNNVNINYALTPTKGALRLNGERSGVILKPNEQAVSTGNQIKVGQVDAQESVSWTNGYFLFEGASMESIMKEFSRWYDIQVVFVNGYPKGQYTATLEKNISLGKALELLKMKDFDLKLQGKTLTIDSHN